MNEKLWIVVYVSSGAANAEIVSGRLQAEGIPTKLNYEAIGRIYGLTMDGLGEVKVLVPPEYQEKARQVLTEFYNGPDLPWDESGSERIP